MRERAERLFTVAAFAVLFILLFLQAMREKITPDEDDCRARGRASDCWKDSNGR